MAKNTIALLMAAGNSTRFGGEIPKVYECLGDKTVLQRSIEAFLKHPRIGGVRVIISRAHNMTYRQQKGDYVIFPAAMGGKTRQESVRRGLDSIAHRKPDYVLIHDAARPLVSPQLIDRVLDALEKYPAVLPAVGVNDTVRQLQDDGSLALLPREKLLLAQTPQGFHFDAIHRAHHRFADEQVTDDIALAQKAGLAVGVVEGERDNFKITTQQDLRIMEHNVGIRL